TRILSADEDVWQDAFEHLTGSSLTQRLPSPDLDARASVRVRPSEEVASRSEEIVEDLDHLAVPPELMARELEILRREKALLERELSLVRRKARMSPSVESGASDRAIDSGFNVRTISDMVSEFRGDCDNFDTWKRQIELLRTTYRLDENSTKVLISLRLKSKALNWFHSKPKHLELSAAELFHEMSRIFDNRPSKLTLRKDFERRKWQNGETFSIFTRSTGYSYAEPGADAAFYINEGFVGRLPKVVVGQRAEAMQSDLREGNDQ
ncbi:hypothetical protein RF55_9977, partial [Lasius niger]